MIRRRNSQIRISDITGAYDWTGRTLNLWLTRARTRAQLAQLDPALRGDIGLGNAQALAEAGKPFWRA